MIRSGLRLRLLAVCATTAAAPVAATLVLAAAFSHMIDPMAAAGEGGILAASAVATASLTAALAFAVLWRVAGRPLSGVDDALRKLLADITAGALEHQCNPDIVDARPGEAAGKATDVASRLVALRETIAEHRQRRLRYENCCADAGDERRATIHRMADRIQNEARLAVDELADHGRAMTNQAQQAAQLGSNCAESIGDILALAQRGHDRVRESAHLASTLSNAADGVVQHVATGRESTGLLQSGLCNAQAGLSEASSCAQDISGSASRIRALAERIDLVALNAAIEAVRVGDVGKSFAIVAAEVQTLAAETAQVTDEMVERVEAMQLVTERTQTAFFGVGQTMGALDGAVAAIDAQMQTQTGGLHGIRDALEASAEEGRELAGRLGDMTEMTRTAQTKLHDVDDHAQQLANSIITLKKTLNRIVRTSVPEADLRRHARLPADRAATIIHGDEHHEGRLIDVSEGGAAVSVAASLAAGVRVELRVDGAGEGIPAQVVSQGPGTGTLRMAFVQPGSAPVTALMARVTH